MVYRERNSDKRAVQIFKGAAALGTLWGAAAGVEYDFSASAGAVKDAISGGSCGFVVGLLGGGSIANIGVHEADQMPCFGQAENSADQFIDDVLEFFRAEPMYRF